MSEKDLEEFQTLYLAFYSNIYDFVVSLFTDDSENITEILQQLDGLDEVIRIAALYTLSWVAYYFQEQDGNDFFREALEKGAPSYRVIVNKDGEEIGHLDDLINPLSPFINSLDPEFGAIPRFARNVAPKPNYFNL